MDYFIEQTNVVEWIYSSLLISVSQRYIAKRKCYLLSWTQMAIISSPIKEASISIYQVIASAKAHMIIASKN